MGGARIDYVKGSGSAIAGQVIISNGKEIASFTAAEDIPIGVIVGRNPLGQIFLARNKTEAEQRTVGISILDGEAGSYDTNFHKSNKGKLIPILIHSGGWVHCETPIDIGKSPFIRFKKGPGGTQLGTVRNDADNSGGEDTAAVNKQFIIRDMSADGKSALVIIQKYLT